MPKKTTIDDLAAMVKRGFDDIRQGQIERHQIVVDELGSIRADIRDIKGTLGPLARVVAAQEHETK